MIQPLFLYSVVGSRDQSISQSIVSVRSVLYVYVYLSVFVEKQSFHKEDYRDKICLLWLECTQAWIDLPVET